MKQRLTRADCVNIQNDGRSYRQIAEAWGVSVGLIHQVKTGRYRASDEPLPPRVTGKNTKPRTHFTPEELAAIREDQRPLRLIAEDYGVSRTTIFYIKNPAAKPKPDTRLPMDG